MNGIGGPPGVGTTEILRPALQQAGYSWDVIDPVSVPRRGAVRRGRLLSSGPSYKALVVDDQTSLPEVAAERLVGLARAGLPVVIYGRPPTAGVGFKGARGEDAAVRAAIRRLRTLPNVRSASSPGALLRALRRLAVRPDFRPRRTTAIVPVHRRTAAGDVWFLYNDSPRRARAS